MTSDSWVDMLISKVALLENVEGSNLLLRGAEEGVSRHVQVRVTLSLLTLHIFAGPAKQCATFLGSVE